MPAHRPVIERLNEKYAIDEETGCWLWTACLDKCGYGKFNMKLPDGRKETLAHRALYFLFKGKIPVDKEIDHLCKTRNCVNPEHLEAVTHEVNILRGDYTSNHRNGRKMYCKRGHELKGSNVLINKWKGYITRKCRTCNNDLSRKRYRNKLILTTTEE